MKTQLQPHYIR